MNALVLGSAGFAGSHLVELLEDAGTTTAEFDIRYGDDPGDVRDYEQVRGILESAQPDLVFYLAAQTSPAESWTDPRRCFDIIQGGALNLLEAVRNLGCEARILLVGSEAEYGTTMRDGRVTEESPCQPQTPYAAAKLAATNLGLAYAARYGLHVVVVRPAYHTGPGQHPRFAVSAFAKRIAEAEIGRRDVVEHGDLTATRAMLDVRDVVRAYRLAIDLQPGIYNVSADTPWSMENVLVTLLNDSPMAADIRFKPNPNLGRLADSTPWHPMSHEKLTAATGWQPGIPFPQTLQDLLDDWRRSVR